MSSGQLRVATFNIHHGRGRDGKVDLGRTASVITEMAPDLIALQELDVNMKRSDRVDQPSALGELIGMKVHFFPALTFGGGEYGIGLAARDELRCNFEELPHLEGDERRIAIVTRWGDLNVVTTHLSRGGKERTVQTEALAGMAGELLGPTVVLGDFNQTARELVVLKEAGFSVARAHVPLRWWLRPHPRVDHILVGDGLRTRRALLVPTRVSDHSALVADVIRAGGVRELVGA